ncbi:MAG: hypothetical protein GY791_06130 [Alphaproteobacteria bacterium]|nr:hypothetical protein [Alphaproteobacteria bacterium]
MCYAIAMALTADIRRRIEADFGVEHVAEIVAVMESARSDDPDVFGDRIIRCALYVSAGNTETLERALALARTDYRDLIVWAEYDNAFGERKRDLGQPFEG